MHVITGASPFLPLKSELSCHLARLLLFIMGFCNAAFHLYLCGLGQQKNLLSGLQRHITEETLQRKLNERT